MKALEATRNAPAITKELNRILNENFVPIDGLYNDLVWQIYGETTRFCTRLNLLHADTLGFAYEKLIRKASGRKESYTSVYTPEDLAKEMISKLAPHKDDVIIDTAAGTGTLLCVATELAWEAFERTPSKIRELKKFFENQVIAIDRDIYALKCCKGMLLATYVKILDEEPSRMGVNWSLPKLREMHHADLFEKRLSKVISLAVGNPPWGNIDAPDNPVGLTQAVRAEIRVADRAIYGDDTDISIYVAKRMLDGRMFKRSDKFRSGLLMKQQILTNVSHQKFRKWAEEKGLKFIDHGAANRFPHSPASKVTECFAGQVDWPHEGYIRRNYTVAVKNEGKPIGNYIMPAKGFESADKSTYIALATKCPNRVKERWVKKLYPSKANALNIVWKADQAQEILFVPSGTKFPRTIKLSIAEKKALKARSQVAEAFPYSWRGCEKVEFYGENLDCPRIFMPRMPSSEGPRIAAGIDLVGEGVGTSGQSIWLKKNDTSLDDFLCILGWVNSKGFLAQLDDAGVTRRASGFNFDPNEVLKIKVPERVFSKQMLAIVTKCLVAGYATDDDLTQIDRIVSGAQPAVALDLETQHKIALGFLRELQKKIKMKQKKNKRVS